MTLPADRAKGIDVNAWHPIQDFSALPSDLSFVGVKATEGNTITDAKLGVHRNGLRALPGLDLVIWYHFARTGSPDLQAARLLNTVGPLQPNERFALDLEVLPDDAGSVLGWVDAFHARIRRAYPGQRQLIYTSARIWSMFGNPSWPGSIDVDLWAPRYNTTGDEPKLPAPWKSWTAWQWSDSETPPYSAPGVGPCDANVWNGDRDAVRAWLTRG